MLTAFLKKVRLHAMNAELSRPCPYNREAVDPMEHLHDAFDHGWRQLTVGSNNRHRTRTTKTRIIQPGPLSLSPLPPVMNTRWGLSHPAFPTPASRTSSLDESMRLPELNQEVIKVNRCP